MLPVPTSSQRPGLFSIILLTGLLAGTLDALAAIAHFRIAGGGNPLRIFQYIASGVLGQQAFTAAWPMALYGICFHYLIAWAFTAFFFVVYPAGRILRFNRIVAGLLYGIFVWLVMNLAVLPLSRVPRPALQLLPAVIGIVILMLMIGLPVALMAHRFYARRAKGPAA